MSESFTPFGKDPNPDLLFESAGHREALARLHLMIQNRYFGALTGEVGSGKSTLIRRLVHDLDPIRYQTIYVNMAGLKPRDFYGELLRQTGEIAPFTLAKAKRLWDEILTTRYLRGDRSVVVLVDEAHEMSEAMLLELRFALNHEMDSLSPYPLILVGQPELRRTLRLKKYEAIAQRIQLQYHLTGLSKDEAASYIRHQMRQAKKEQVFSDSAMQMIYGASQNGIPRLINTICTQVLAEVERLSSQVVEESHVGRVLADQERQRGA